MKNEEIMELLVKNGKKNKGFFYQRVKLRPFVNEWKNKEKIFAEEWVKINKNKIYDFGLLQTLFFVKDINNISPGYLLLKITPIQRCIVATVIQWFGSNCGFSFLVDCLKECGYKLEKIKK